MVAKSAFLFLGDSRVGRPLSEGGKGPGLQNTMKGGNDGSERIIYKSR